MNLVRLLCRAHERTTEGQGEMRPISILAARPATSSEEMMFQRSAMSGCVRLAGILIPEDLQAS